MRSVRGGIEAGWLNSFGNNARVLPRGHVIKNLFRHRQTRYRGLARNTARLFTLFAFASLVLAGRRFTVTETRRAS